MTVWDIINPWGALRRARLELHNETACFRHESARLRENCTDAYKRADQHSLTALARANEIARLRKLVASGHFRNPKTGRLGVKGQTFD